MKFSLILNTLLFLPSHVFAGGTRGGDRADRADRALVFTASRECKAELAVKSDENIFILSTFKAEDDSSRHSARDKAFECMKDIVNGGGDNEENIPPQCRDSQTFPKIVDFGQTQVMCDAWNHVCQLVKDKENGDIGAFVQFVGHTSGDAGCSLSDDSQTVGDGVLGDFFMACDAETMESYCGVGTTSSSVLKVPLRHFAFVGEGPCRGDDGSAYNTVTRSCDKGICDKEECLEDCFRHYGHLDIFQGVQLTSSQLGYEQCSCIFEATPIEESFANLKASSSFIDDDSESFVGTLKNGPFKLFEEDSDYHITCIAKNSGPAAESENTIQGPLNDFTVVGSGEGYCTDSKDEIFDYLMCSDCFEGDQQGCVNACDKELGHLPYFVGVEHGIEGDEDDNVRVSFCACYLDDNRKDFSGKRGFVPDPRLELAASGSPSQKNTIGVDVDRTLATAQDPNPTTTTCLASRTPPFLVTDIPTSSPTMSPTQSPTVSRESRIANMTPFRMQNHQNNNLCLDLDGAAQAGGRMAVRPCHDLLASQLWFKDEAGGIRPSLNIDLCVTADKAFTQNTFLTLQSCDPQNRSRQQWNVDEKTLEVKSVNAPNSREWGVANGCNGVQAGRAVKLQMDFSGFFNSGNCRSQQQWRFTTVSFTSSTTSSPTTSPTSSPTISPPSPPTTSPPSSPTSSPF